MNSYIYLKPNPYRSYGTPLDVVTRGQAGTDAEAIALARDGEIVARVVDGQPALREDGEQLKRAEEPIEVAPAVPVPVSEVPL